MAPKPYLRDYQAEAIRLLAIGGHWIVAGVETHIGWPQVAQVVEYQEKDFVLRPGNADLMPSIAFNADAYNLEHTAARELMLAFASALAWMAHEKLEISTWVGGGYPIGIGRRKMQSVSDFLDARMLPSAMDDLAQTALAFFREGLSSGNPFYAFLNFFKVISLFSNNGKDRERWMKDALPRMDYPRAKERYAELAASGMEDIGSYLYLEGRNAIAHAEKEPYISPDRLADHQRIDKDLPMIQNLAALAIEDACGLLRSWSQFEQRDVLGGLIALFGDEAVTAIRRSTIQPETTVRIPESVTIVARRSPETFAFERLQMEPVHAVDGLLVVLCTDSDKTLQFELIFDFAHNKFEFDPISQFGRQQDLDSYEGVMREIAYQKFTWCMFRNGSLELWDDETNELLAKSSPVMLVNMILNVEGHNATMTFLEQKRENFLAASTGDPLQK
jgi:hypothetical protein